MMIIPILISQAGGCCIFTVKMLTLSGERFMQGKNMLEPFKAVAMRLSIRHLLSQNLQQTAVENRGCVFTVKNEPLHKIWKLRYNHKQKEEYKHKIK